jgi:hypothetical protein
MFKLSFTFKRIEAHGHCISWLYVHAAFFSAQILIATTSGHLALVGIVSVAFVKQVELYLDLLGFLMPCTWP